MTMVMRALAALPLVAAALAASAGPTLGQAGSRPEVRSYQPYSGLQEEPVVPLPPAERGVERKRPEIPTPRARSPVIIHGAPEAYTAQWYVYCAAKHQSFEPGDGLYTTYSGRRRICR